MEWLRSRKGIHMKKFLKGILVLALLTVLVWGIVDSISMQSIKVRDCEQLNFNGLPYNVYYNHLTQKFYRQKFTVDELLPAYRLIPLTSDETKQIKLILENIYQETKQYIDILSYGWQ